jgi:hypothetical protein
VSIENTEYIPKEIALDYCRHFFDANEQGIVLKKTIYKFFYYYDEHQRYPFESISVYVKPTVNKEGNIEWDKTVFIILSTQNVGVTNYAFETAFNNNSEIYNGWTKFLHINDGDLNEKNTRKLVSALSALGANIAVVNK